MRPTTELCRRRSHEVDGRSTGGASQKPPVSKPLSTKAFQEKTGGWEVIKKLPRHQRQRGLTVVDRGNAIIPLAIR